MIEAMVSMKTNANENKNGDVEESATEEENNDDDDTDPLI